MYSLKNIFIFKCQSINNPVYYHLIQHFNLKHMKVLTNSATDKYNQPLPYKPLMFMYTVVF